MAHSRFALTTMYDWIEARVTAGEPAPTDGEIFQRFSFHSLESARTLLAELADAGRITIKGYGDTRKVTLGRQRHALEPVERPVPTVAKADPVVDATTARIAGILNRGRKPARAVVAENAAKLLSTVTTPAAPAAAQPAKEPVMAGKSFMLPATATSAIAAIEALAKSDDISLGHAAAVLIGRGAQPAPAAAAAIPAEHVPSVDTIVADIGRVFADLSSQAARPDQSADLAAAIERAEAAEARATEAEGKVAEAKKLFA
jgi:hypothetical protein